MRTDVKVGLICVFAVILAVVIYFVMQGNSHPQPAQVQQLASLPSREQLLAELGAGFMSPMAAFAGAMNGLLYMFAGALDALKTQREGA